MYKTTSAAPSFPRIHRQGGQALIYGMFVLVAGLTALLFLFNTSQLTAEKSKLVNTADAVAYSAGVMHARALNFDAYTNRALMANEVMIAQAVSIASWTKHVVAHTQNVPPLLCQDVYSKPVALALLTYIPVCYLLSFAGAEAAATVNDETVRSAAQATIALSEAAKHELQRAQSTMAATFIPARTTVMQQVADANYVNDGAVHVDALALADDFPNFIQSYVGADRGRFQNATVTAAYRDDFVKGRSWTSANYFPCIFGNKAEFRRRGGTELIGFDEWKAMDTASLHEWHWHTHGIFHWPSCDDSETPLGYGAHAAANGTPDDSTAQYGNSRQDNRDASTRADSSFATETDSGLPTFSDLSASALALPSDPGPRLKFSIRLTRDKRQTRTSDGTSAIKPSGRLAIYQGTPKSDVLAAVSTSEVFFQRPVARGDGKAELASLFNPYWQVRLIPTSAADVSQAMARGGPQ